MTEVKNVQTESELRSLDGSESPGSVVESDRDLSSLTSASTIQNPTSTSGALQNYMFHLPVDNRGTELYLRGWLNASSKSHPILIIGDIGETSTRYRECARSVYEQGFNTYTYDHRGHGRSGGALGHIEQFNDLVTDFIQVASWLRYQNQRRQPSIIAHGLGGLIALGGMCKMPHLFNSALLIAPSYRIPISLAKKTVVKILSEIWPRVRLTKKITPRSILSSRSQLPKITANLAHEILVMEKNWASYIANIKTPVTMFLPNKKDKYIYSGIVESAELNTDYSLFDIRYFDAFSYRGIFKNRDLAPLFHDELVQWLILHMNSISSSLGENELVSK